jgi:uracil-DNA glycosylase
VNERVDATPYLPDRLSMKSLREAAEECRGCGLWRDATQVVFGAGPPRSARMMLVGEQPGDREDREGAPFVGPAGKLLDRALEEAGIDRREAYVTNAVKHFKWRPAGKRRLHQRPSAEEVRACRPWLEAELAVVKPEAIVALGATAAKSLYGPSVRVTRDRGTLIESDLAPLASATIHPSSLLRVEDAEERRIGIAELAADLASIASKLAA